MKFIRIFLLVLIIIGVGLSVTQKMWVPKVVEMILKNENKSNNNSLVSVETVARPAANILYRKNAQELFIYKGKPIHPFCIDSSDASETISLDTCSDSKSKVQNNEGIFSADYTTDQNFPNSNSGYSRYEVLAKKGNNFLLSTETSGGGSGIFTSISWFKLEGGNITYIKSLASGDRCNGGVNSVEARNNILYYSIEATSPDLVEIAFPGTVGIHDQGNFLIEPYKELEASASSCFATLDYEYDLINETSNLKTVSLDTDGVYDDAGWVSQYTYQACFNNIYNDYLNESKTVLTPEDLKTFVQQFFTKCKVKKLK